MVPFCRRTEEARSLVEAMGKCGLKGGNGLEKRWHATFRASSSRGGLFEEC